MSGDRYICCDERRRLLLLDPAAPPGLSGIDYIEVEAPGDTSLPTLIQIYLVKPLALPAATLTAANIRLSGGVRYPAPTIAAAIAVSPGGGSVARYTLTIPGGQPSDFSTYLLELVGAPGSDEPPAFIDRRLSRVEFSFKIDCPSDADCAPDCEPDPAPPLSDAHFDYRVRDYQGFRGQILDRMRALVPGFVADDPVDFTVTLVEALAARADQQSYKLDWVGTEAFLSTARSRTSLARHARLVDYAIGEGASARAFVSFDFTAGSVADGMILPRGTPLLVRQDGQPGVIAASDYRRFFAASPVVFETMADLALWDWRSTIALHSWGDDECRLPRGATAATLVDGSGGAAASRLKPGDLVLFEEVRSPDTGDPADADAAHRHAVRLTSVKPVVDQLFPLLALVTIAWAEPDALPFDLIVQRPRAIGLSDPDRICAVARGNVMVSDHGQSAPPVAALGLVSADIEALRPRLIPPMPGDGPWTPVLDRRDVARGVPLDWLAPVPAPAQELAQVDPAECLAEFRLDDDFADWRAQRDLLRSTAFDRHFVVETAIGGEVAIRFGDDVNGMAPSPATLLVPSGRFGSGIAGNVGAGALAHVVVADVGAAARITVTNPLAARGGAAPETSASIRVNAPQAFRVQHRAVTAADYAWAAGLYEEVANAVAIPRWTGAWQTMLVMIDRKGGKPVDRAFAAGLADHLEFYRLMDFDVAIRGARMTPLDIELFVCAKPGTLRSTVAGAVRRALNPRGDGFGPTGFFDPDRFTFGTPLYLSALIAAVMAVDGVQSVTPRKFQRQGQVAHDEIANGVIRPNALEVLQLSDDPSFPEQGRLALAMGGGR